MRTTLKILFLATLLSVLVVAILFWRAGGIGQSVLEAIVGEQLQSAVAAHGDLRLSFDSIDYQTPNRVIIERLHLSRFFADGNSADLVEVDHAQIDLDELPRRGKPIVIRAVTLTKPIVHIDAFLRPRAQPRTPTTRRALSSILKLEHVTIHQGTIDYDDGSGGPPLSWQDLGVSLNLEQANAPSNQNDNWHRAHITLDQSPLIALDLSGEINLDEVAVRALALSLRTNLDDPKALRFFTPRLQALVKKFEVRGTGSIDARGAGSLNEPKAATLDLNATLVGGNLTIGHYRLPIERIDAAVNVRNGVATLARTTFALIGGQATASGTMSLATPQLIDARLVGEHLDLKQLMRDGGDDRSRISGELDGKLRFVPSARELKLVNKPEGDSVVWTSGEVHVRNGRLVNLPILGELISATRQVTNLVTREDGVYHDRLDAEVVGIGRRVRLSDAVYAGDLVAARGNGTIAFNGDLDLTMNAGPLENLQERLGPIGELWGKISDRVMSYAVRGTLHAPQVTAQAGR